MSKIKSESTYVIDIPKLFKQWHPTKNGELKAEVVSKWSRKKIWWKCEKGSDHEWLATPHDRYYKNNGCPYCRGLKVSLTNSLAILHPHLVMQWHPVKNGKLKPHMVVAGSHKSVWWECDKGLDHEWKTRISHRTGKAKSGCPFCAGQKVSVTNSLATLYPDIAKEWHQEKNGDITPDKVIAGSGKQYWWKCDKGPDHIWKAAPNSRTYQHRGCPFCAGQKVSVTNSLATLYPDIAKEWFQEKNGDIAPIHVTAGSSKKFWWRCDKGPDHIWRATLTNRIRSSGGGCPFCAGQKVSVTNSLAILYPNVAKEWFQEKNGDITPDKVIAGSGKQYWWKCEKGSNHIWRTSPHLRTGSSSTGCPYCNIGGDAELTGYLWERICYRIALQLLKKEKWSWQPKIETPDFKEKKWIFPEILIEKEGGMTEIIEVKKSPLAIRFKDVVIYPKYAERVVFWCLYMEPPAQFDDIQSFVFVSSDELVEQLKQKTTKENERTILRILSDIRKLKKGTILTQQKLLSDFINESQN